MGAVLNLRDGVLAFVIIHSAPLGRSGIHVIHIMIHAWLHLKVVWACRLPWWIKLVLKAPSHVFRGLCFFGKYHCNQSERMVSIVFWNVEDAWNWQNNKFRLHCWFQTVGYHQTCANVRMLWKILAHHDPSRNQLYTLPKPIQNVRCATWGSIISLSCELLSKWIIKLDHTRSKIDFSL